MRTAKSMLLTIALVCLLPLAGGCSGGDWLSFNIIIPLGLDGEGGLLSGFGDGSVFVPPTNGNGDTEPPIPIQVGDEPGGGTVTN